MARRGSPLTPEFQRAIVWLKDYVDRPQDDGRAQACSRTESAAQAWGVGRAPVQRVRADSPRRPRGVEREESLRRGRPPRASAEALPPLTSAEGRPAHREGAHRTRALLAAPRPQEGAAPNGSLRTRGRTRARGGCTCGKGRRAPHLKDKAPVGAARQRSRRAKRAHRHGDEGRRPAVEVEESEVNQTPSHACMWYSDEEGPWGQKPTGKGERRLLIPAMTTKGGRAGAPLTLQSTKKTGDDHGPRPHDLFPTWFTAQCLPQRPAKALMSLDNAPYQQVLAQHAAPTAPCKKDSIAAGWRKNGRPVRDAGLKAAWGARLAQWAPPPLDALDERAAAQGHEI